MLDFLTDDQIAQIGCAAAIMAAIGITSLSYWLGNARHHAGPQMSMRLRAMSDAQSAVNSAIANAHRRKAA
jgi:hypothetical protein